MRIDCGDHGVARVLGVDDAGVNRPAHARKQAKFRVVVIAFMRHEIVDRPHEPRALGTHRAQLSEECLAHHPAGQPVPEPAVLDPVKVHCIGPATEERQIRTLCATGVDSELPQLLKEPRLVGVLRDERRMHHAKWTRARMAAAHGVLGRGQRAFHSPGITVEAIDPCHGLDALACNLRSMRPLRAP